MALSFSLVDIVIAFVLGGLAMWLVIVVVYGSE